MYGNVVVIIFISSVHILLGVISFITGVLTSIQSLIWMAHTVSPIWSGVFVSIMKNKNAG